MEQRSPHVGAETPVPMARGIRRRLMVRDSFTFLVLLLVAGALALVTTFLFRSFEAHREDLATQSAQQGKMSLQHGDAAQAVTAFRTSLTYRPDDRDTQNALAQALAESGHTEEAENYFLNLRQAQPGDGLINLQLARLERSRGNVSAATEYYRAAVFGTWQGDAPTRRRDTRLELAQFLIARGQMDAARAELLVTAGNNPDAAAQLQIAPLLDAAGDPDGALKAYRSASLTGRSRAVADAKAGELCYRMGGYSCAHESLQIALRAGSWTAEQTARMSQLRDDAAQLQELAYGGETKQADRVPHLLGDARLAQVRAKTCAAARGSGASSPMLQQVETRWRLLDTAKNRRVAVHDDSLQQQYASLVASTETATTEICGAPAGQDALLGYLLQHPMTHFGAVSE